MFGTGEIILLVLVVVLVFGAAKIPQLGKALGEGIRNFKKATTDDSIDVTPKLDKPDEKKT
jgi:sec-independent protein translocase protein TatA